MIKNLWRLCILEGYSLTVYVLIDIIGFINMTKSRKPRVSKGTKESKSEDVKQSESDETQGDIESRSTTSEESPQTSQVPPISSSISEDTEQSRGTSESVSKSKDTRVSQGTSVLDSEYPSCPDSRGTTSDESQQTAQAMATSSALRGAATASSITRPRRKILVPRDPRVEGDKRKKSASRVAESWRRRDTPVSNEKSSNSRASTSSRAKADNTQIKSMPKRLGKYKLRNRSKHDNLKPNPLDEAYSSPSITDLSFSSLNIGESVSTGTHQDDSNISEYSAHETSDSENETS
ncbi:hypothetical protein Anas_11776 [Armadillidium nasatum]|uniref:Uncharacterized protein n=1 Tax=Armadillidium nasatum TaxID=96803 RepID=A0A5N5TIW7_9CRUS|nr:hypothetical protein Anas_11776 [Armadillidium nasatum]